VITVALAPDPLKVLEGIELSGDLNTSEGDVLANIQHSIRLGYPQVKPQPAQPDRVVLVGGGPSLEETFGELRDLVFAGAKLVTVNGAYQWCLDRNLRPSAQIVLDARATNARFVQPTVPGCKYLLASQCHPETWAAVRGCPEVWIWHSLSEASAYKDVLDAYYLKAWHGVIGGTTVITRALVLLRALGYLRFDLFGVDSCWLDRSHHAFDQPENDLDRRMRILVHPTGHPELGQTFDCAPWHLQQLQDFLQIVRIHGHHFLMSVHGPGLLAYALRASAELVLTEQE
jgi:hypothetical protein